MVLNFFFNIIIYYYFIIYFIYFILKNYRGDHITLLAASEVYEIRIFILSNVESNVFLFMYIIFIYIRFYSYYY